MCVSGLIDKYKLEGFALSANCNENCSIPKTLDYFKLTCRARTMAVDPTLRPVRIALLADCSTQHLAPLIRVLGADRGLDIEIYEAPYGNIVLEAVNPQADLYQFRPDFTVLLCQTEPVVRRLLSRDARLTAESWLQTQIALWDTLAARLPGPILQTTFVQPAFRAFGHYESLVANSLGSQVAAINSGLVRAARERANVLITDVDFLAAEVGRRHWRDEKMWLMAKLPCALEHLPLLADALVGQVAAAVGKIAKVVVLDLDNTLWGGVIGDDGVDGIRLGDFEDGEAFVALQQHLLSLKERGIVLAVCSKNEKAAAIQPFEQHPDMVLRLDDIAIFVANWNDKASNIRTIAETLNLGLDSFVFLDDNPFERNLVRGLLPEVQIPELPDEPELYVSTLAQLNLFETTSFSQADRERVEQYRVEAARVQLQADFASVDDYLRSLEMTVTCERFTLANLPRIAQLMQRSNQFNLATRRYSEGECARMREDHARFYPFTLSLADRFGGYGLISVVVLRLRAEEVEIKEFLMSCRVLKRGVEAFAMNQIFEAARKHGAQRVIGRYIPTKKNAMVVDFYPSFGFTRLETAETGEVVWTQDVTAYEARPALMLPLYPAEKIEEMLS